MFLQRFSRSPGLTAMARYHPEPAPNELSELIDKAVTAVSLPAALAILGVHRTTLMRWRTGKVRVPNAALALLRVWSESKLPGMGREWDGFRFEGNFLVSPAGVRYTPREMLAWHWKDQQLEHQRDRISQLEKIVHDQARRMQAMSSAANDIAHDPTRPPSRPRRAVR